MLDKLTIFDWITPTVSFVQKARGRAVTFSIPIETYNNMTLPGKPKRLEFIRGNAVFDLDIKDAQQLQKEIQCRS